MELRARIVVRRKAVVDVGVITITGCKPCASDSRKLDVADFATCLVELNHIRCDIFDVRNNEASTCGGDAFDVF